ncbi:hypothetical protein HQ447_01080 [bacterium]|nr:hypothetical protein [bacterium]
MNGNGLSINFNGESDWLTTRKGIAPLPWNGNDTANIRSLIETFLSHLYAKYPGIRDARYDFETGRFLGRNGLPIHERGGGSFDQASRSGMGRSARAGEATLRRGIFLQSLVSSDGGKRSDILGQLLSRGNQHLGEAGLGKTVFLSRYHVG